MAAVDGDKTCGLINSVVAARRPKLVEMSSRNVLMAILMLMLALLYAWACTTMTIRWRSATESETPPGAG